jgi:hypothetical protein
MPVPLKKNKNHRIMSIDDLKRALIKLISFFNNNKPVNKIQ